MSIDQPDKYQVNQTDPDACVSLLDNQAPKPLMAARKQGRNLGLGSRNLTRAGKTCAHQSGKAFATRGTLAERWSVFAKWLEQTHDIKRMEDINREHVMAYGQALKGRVERDEMKASTAQLYVSAVNSIMTSATQGEWQTVSPTKDCGIPKRRYIPETSKAMPQSQHDQLQTSVDDERITVLLNLQRTLGLRFKESVLLDAQKALRQAQREGRITVFSGTKGGKRCHVPESAEAMAALEKAADLQDGPSMVPANLRYIDFRNHCYPPGTTAAIPVSWPASLLCPEALPGINLRTGAHQYDNLQI